MIYAFETMGTVVSLEPPLCVPEIETLFAQYNSPFGLQKALAMDAAGRLLQDHDDWILSVGGDILASCAGATIGIADPAHRTGLLTSVVLSGSRRAVATSGISEPGDHGWGRGAFAQVTVVANDIITADALAAAILAGGWDTLNHATSAYDIDVLAIDRQGNVAATPGMRPKLAA